MRYSFVIPLYNRPEGISLLLDSFLAYAPAQADYELIIVEDGSDRPAENEISAYMGRLPLRYLLQRSNLGPAAARNLGSQQAQGAYLLFMDSDTALSAGYFSVLEAALAEKPELAFTGGTEGLPSDSSPWQRAIHYSMCAWLSTGGIRGHKKTLEGFKPRTHNMLISRNLFHKVGGFNPALRYGEDMDLALRMEKAGYSGQLLPGLQVLHYRKAGIRGFFRQVYCSGRARVQLERLHPGSTRLVHRLPALFLLGLLASGTAAALGGPEVLGPWGLYFAALWVEISYKAKHPGIGGLATIAACVQLTGYGLGYLLAYMGLRTP